MTEQELAKLRVLRKRQAFEPLEYAWMGLGDTSALEVPDPLVGVTEAPSDVHVLEPLVRVLRDPAYFGFTVKHLFGKTILPLQMAVLHELWWRPFPMLIGTRGLGKSWILALYSMLRMLLCQGVKIVVVGAGFRQARLIFEYAEELWMNAPIVRDLCGSRGGPKRELDRCVLRVGDSVMYAIPIGDGSKIRGLRANIIISDEFASLNNEIFENVVSGFAAVSMDPIEKVKAAARQAARERLGLCVREEDPELVVPGLNSNQTIISGTAYYAFNHFHDYWRRWKAIVESRGDPRVLADVFKGESPSNFNWRDYSVLRIPVDCLPAGFMDERHVSKARATIHVGQYLMEYGACLTGETPVLTAAGYRPVRDLKPGDRVMTHRGRFRPVRRVTCRHVDRQVVECVAPEAPACTLTAEHPVFCRGEWVPVGRADSATLPDWREDAAAAAPRFVGATTAVPLSFATGQALGRLLQTSPLDGDPALYELLDGSGSDTHLRPEVFAGPEPFLRGLALGLLGGRKGLCYLPARLHGERLTEQLLTLFGRYGIHLKVTRRAGGCYRFTQMKGASLKRARALLEGRPARGGDREVRFTKRFVDYVGPVYNLEVEEDNSYVLPVGAVHNCFQADSNGFFKRSLIEACVAGRPRNPIYHDSCGLLSYSAVLKGSPGMRYVMAVDPASENDNFSIVVLELWPDHRRIVHCWTTTRKRHRAKLASGLAAEEDFYSYAARKIRDLLRVFPCERIALDAQGGGVSVAEALGDSARLRDGEEPIYPAVDPEKPRDTDRMPGLHLLELIQFARADWVVEANHGLRKDLEDRVLTFPEFDSAVLGLAIEEDQLLGRVSPEAQKLYDTLEDCMMEIEELKDELATIVHTQTGTTMRDRWDTPEVRLAGGRRGRLRKDRYSALLMANMVARQAKGPAALAPSSPYSGGFAHELVHALKGRQQRAAPSWHNPEWYTAGVRGSYGAVVRKGGV